MKGTFAIFTIKLMVIGAIFIVQSCQNEENIFVESEQELALKNFETLARETIQRTNIIIDNFQYSKKQIKE